MSEFSKEIRDYTGSREFIDKLRADLVLNSEAGKNQENQDFIGSLRASMGIEWLTSKVATLEKAANKPEDKFPVEEFDRKAEYGEGKYEAVGNVGAAYGATGTANGVTAELTGASASVKLWSYDKSIINDLVDEAKLQTPEHLRKGLDIVERDLGVARRDITRGREVTDRAHVRITDLVRDMNRKLGLKADKTAMRNTDAQRTPQIQNARRTADEASASIDLLTRRLRDLGIAI
ncbi:hypothetical protein [Streptomyces sp. NPDC051662]|uniref:hypothetical protein n=1 Tax=Streptomyces sp. NPDC051662 TaxID=3154750 RepID=UPI0034376272